MECVGVRVDPNPQREREGTHLLNILNIHHDFTRSWDILYYHTAVQCRAAAPKENVTNKKPNRI